MLLKGLMFLFKMLQKLSHTLFAVAFLYFFFCRQKIFRAGQRITRCK